MWKRSIWTSPGKMRHVFKTGGGASWGKGTPGKARRHFLLPASGETTGSQSRECEGGEGGVK